MCLSLAQMELRSHAHTPAACTEPSPPPLLPVRQAGKVGDHCLKGLSGVGPDQLRKPLAVSLRSNGEALSHAPGESEVGWGRTKGRLSWWLHLSRGILLQKATLTTSPC